MLKQMMGTLRKASAKIKCPKCIVNPPETVCMQSHLRRRQETGNARFKNWGILRNRHEQSVADHDRVINAVAVLTQLAINAGEKLFWTSYRDPPYTNTGYDVSNDDVSDDEMSL